MRNQIMMLLIIILVTTSLHADDLQYKDRLIDVLVKHVPEILNSYDAKTGRFGEGIWISTDQNRMWPVNQRNWNLKREAASCGSKCVRRHESIMQRLKCPSWQRTADVHPAVTHERQCQVVGNASQDLDKQVKRLAA